MISAPALVAWLEASAPDVKDRNGYPSRVPHALAEVIADTAIATPIFAAPEGVVEAVAEADARILVTAGTLLVFAFYESSYQRSALGDHGIACGSWQHHALTRSGAFDAGQCERLRHDWRYAAGVAVEDFRRSAAAGPAHPWAVYAGGSVLAGASTSDARAALVRDLIARRPVPAVTLAGVP